MNRLREHRQRRVHSVGLMSAAFVALICGSILGAQTPEAATLTISVKGSSAYAQPTPVPALTALLVVTPSWEDMLAKTPRGGREAADQPLFMSDIAVVFSNLALDCATVFKPTLAAPQDFLIAAGRAEAYLPGNGWPSTTIGKALSDSATDRTLTIDRFSLEAQYTAAKKKTSSKDNLSGGNGRLVLTQKGSAWSADFMAKADELVVEGKLPVKSCGIVTRKRADMMPLLQEKRLLTAADKYGM